MAGNYIDHWNANGQMYDIQDAGRGLPNGVATLDLDGRVPYSQLPESAVEFKGYWNAATNTPTLADGTGTKGDMYYVDVAGTRDLGSGVQRFYVGDRVLYDGSVWKNMNPDLIDLFLPVGHLIWTSNANFNPNTQYPGTTWTQIKDRFILAAGDTYTNGSTGGDATVTLTVDQMPSHAHGGTTGIENQNHTHSGITNEGGVDHDHTFSYSYSVTNVLDGGVQLSDFSTFTSDKTLYRKTETNNGATSTASAYLHTHGFTTEVESQNHVHNISAQGGGQAHNNMPPYIVKYCWERTA